MLPEPAAGHASRGRAPRSDLAEHALRYAGWGWRVVPLHGITEDLSCACGNPRCEHPGKHPHLTNWTRRATTDREQILRYWAEFPDANVGIATGAGSDLIGLDVDPRNGGRQTLDRLVEIHEPLPETVRVHTGGGEHLYLRHPDPAVRIGNTVLGPGLEIKGERGLLVAPPSLHFSGKHYVFDPARHPDVVAVAPLPPWLADLATRRVDRGGAATRPQRSRSLREIARILDGVPEGERDTSLFFVACSLRARDIPHDLAEVVVEAAAKRCKPPFPRDLARQKVAWAYRHYAPNSPTIRPPTGSGAPARLGRPTPEQMAILDVLHEAGEPLKPSEIARRLGKSPGSVRYLVHQHLVPNRLVRKVPDGYILNDPTEAHASAGTALPPLTLVPPLAFGARR